MLNRSVSAEEAVALGLVTRVVADGELESEAITIARQLAAGPPTALAHIKRLLRSTWSATLAEQLAAETAAMLDCGGTPDAREGVEAFVARRAPRFIGTSKERGNG
jgi:2-(1,2-epoxy-1,2-dihydrophenyl)acetyl-CoA isomerase